MKLQEFIKNNEKLAIFIQKRYPDELVEGSESVGTQTDSNLPPSPSPLSEPTYQLTLELVFTNDKTKVLAFTKRNPVKFSPSELRSEKQVSTQIQAIELGEGSPIDILHSYIASTFEPYFVTYAQNRFNFREGVKDVQIGLLIFFF